MDRRIRIRAVLDGDFFAIGGSVVEEDNQVGSEYQNPSMAASKRGVIISPSASNSSVRASKPCRGLWNVRRNFIV